MFNFFNRLFSRFTFRRNPGEDPKEKANFQDQKASEILKSPESPEISLSASPLKSTDLEKSWTILGSSGLTLEIKDSLKLQLDQELTKLRNKPTRIDLVSLSDRIQTKIQAEVQNNIQKKFGLDLLDLLKFPDQTKLPPDLRRSIYKEALMTLSDSWNSRIKEIFPGIKSDLDWNPTRSQKNLIGQMIDFAERSSPEHLSVRGLASVIKNLHLCLIQTIQTFSEVGSAESEAVLEILLEILTPIVEIWMKTLKNVKSSLARQGVLPQKWAKEAKTAKTAKNKIDARFSDGDSDELIRRRLNGNFQSAGIFCSAEAMKDKKRILEEQLLLKSFR